jgi:hypothetical protein
MNQALYAHMNNKRKRKKKEYMGPHVVFEAKAYVLILAK